MGGESALPDSFLLLSFPCSVNHERDWPPCKVVFFGLATNTLNVIKQQQLYILTLILFYIFVLASLHDGDSCKLYSITSNFSPTLRVL